MSLYGSSARYRIVEDTFQRAADLPEDRRAEFLRQSCGTDTALRAEVEALLRSLAAAGTTFDRPLFDRSAMDNTSDPVRIGKYYIERRLGQGGMAIVFEATQDHPRRRVAIKLIRPGAFSTRSRGRFELEAAVLARLQHPGIAHIYEAGLADVDYPAGRAAQQPYFVMELVRGDTLLQHVRTHGLSTTRRLELFLKICDAVEHAHSKGVIHRDLKPANIIVSPSGEPKVLDFGVASATGTDLHATTLDNEAVLVGTLPYMSPEQVSARFDQLDTRSDVYASGVVLHELLVGKLPYDLTDLSIAAAARVIAEAPPTPLGAADRALRGDLETIVGKALAKDPAQRYASVHALSDDIRRFLNHEPIAARPPGTLYQATRFAQRNKALVAGVIATILSLSIGLSIAVHGLAAAAHERDQAEAALAAEAAARAEAEAIATFIGEMLTSADPKRQGRDARVVDLLDASAKGVGTRFTDQPLVEARLRHVIGTTYQSLGLYDDAEPHLSFALDTRMRLLGERHPDTLDSMHELGTLYNDWGRYTDAESLYARALELHQQVYGPRHERTQRSMHALAQLYSRQGRLEDALAWHEEALRVSRDLFGEDHPTTLSAAGSLGLVYRQLGRFDEALGLYEPTLAARRRVLGEEHPDTLVSKNNLAHLYRALGRNDDALQLHAQTLETRRRVLGNEHPQTVISMDNLAMVLCDLERHDEAEALYLEALAHKRRIYGEEGVQTLVTLHNLARNTALCGNLDEAEQLLTQTLAARRRVLGDDHPETLNSLIELGGVLESQERLAEAESCMLQALAAFRRTLGNDHPDTLKAVNRMALILQLQRKLVEAEPYFRELLAGNQRTKGQDHFETLIALNNLGALLRDQGRFAEAEACTAEASQAARRKFAPGAWQTGVFLYQHGRTLLALERFAEAEAALLESQEILVSAVGPSHQRTITCVQMLVELYDAWHTVEPDHGHDAQAEEWRAAECVAESASK